MRFTNSVTIDFWSDESLEPHCIADANLIGRFAGSPGRALFSARNRVRTSRKDDHFTNVN